MNQTALNNLRQRYLEHTRGRGAELRDIADELHNNAPRGGTNLNSFGQNRSAAGEVPAVEFGNLLADIQNGLTETPTGVTVLVNRKFLEYGTWKMGAHPLGRLAIEALKGTINGS
jgi:hypothetical protein